MREDSECRDARKGLTTWQIVKSSLAAAIGVQTEEARQRDFTEGRAGPFIIAGIVFTAVFVLVLVLVVRVVISNAGL